MVFWLIWLISVKLGFNFSLWGRAKKSNLKCIQVQQCGWVQPWFVVWWLNISQDFSLIPDISNKLPEFPYISGIFSKILTSSTPTWTFSSLIIPASSSHLLQHRLGGVESSLVWDHCAKMTVVLTSVFSLMWWP